MKTNKLVVVGVGHVGSYVLADAMKAGVFGEIGVIDIDENIARGEAVDQEQARALTYMNNIKVTHGGYEQIDDADVIVIAAGNSMKPDPNDPTAEPDRATLAKTTSKTIRDVMGNIVERTKEAIIIVITNPLDTILYIAENEFDYPEGKIFGTGTMLDSARLRNVFANAYDVDPKSVVGYMMGEHGATAFPVLSKLNIQGVAYEELDQYFDRDPQVDLSSPEDIKKNVVSAAYDVFNGKGWTNAGVAQAAVTMAKAVVLDERSVYPACTTLRGEYGYNGNVALSMPCIIGVNGVEKRLPVSLNTWEEEKLHESAAYIQKAMQDADVKF
ncbi:lactate/malate family dehydrogenase [Aerococcus viridans]|uniref:lactate/malate family dehydrogenase n=1 Tax=Aerococcus viridans TaxID=1377 RepID=UPI002DB55F78|nr:L-lactate dehydrogenase [Aerococcus viridans]MEC1386400.1 L-lactate dehydrogenase [Aerococcus viridans]